MDSSQHVHREQKQGLWGLSVLLLCNDDFDISVAVNTCKTRLFGPYNSAVRALDTARASRHSVSVFVYDNNFAIHTTVHWEDWKPVKVGRNRPYEV